MISPLTVPTPTVNTRTPRSAAIFAASRGSGPVVVWPSVSRMIAAELYEPGATGFGGTASGRDSPSAAPRRGSPRGL